ncbi:hypothetical protein [Micromonospora craniellae]|uniref:Uncharacterized protein n=1 Tax=Micromonospora craniellae TaxID=2294034 RepID=A0A372G3F4_9ACTN|nr:hypothetical protein [Micromonospora craniellae]QOC91127.1 hypothetical protein ID554_24270 [Micromonospora craniellae]RFS47250.1 hypothetical protein D0Q02_06715 [Micromonospora craniellae]
MSTFDEYAALARHLCAQQRAGEQGVADEAERRRHLEAAVQYLDQRLNAQGQRLDDLGRAIGLDPGVAVPPPGVRPVSGQPMPPGAAPLSAPPGVPPVPPGTAPISRVPGPAEPPSIAGHQPVSEPSSVGGAATAPRRPGVGAYFHSGVGEEGRALPVVVGTTAAGAPAQRAGEVDPATELELARRWADEADRYAQQTEFVAQRPALLPTWSPMARAVAVYLGFSGVAVVLMLVMVLASGVGAVSFGTLIAWMCAGLPAVALIGGWLVLGRWGRPAAGAATPPRYPLLGFLLCFLSVPLAYCGYLLIFRTLR